MGDVPGDAAGPHHVHPGDVIVAEDQRDGTGVVVKALLFTAAVLVAAGSWMLATSDGKLVGGLFLAAGLADGAMALGFLRRGGS